MQKFILPSLSLINIGLTMTLFDIDVGLIKGTIQYGQTRKHCLQQQLRKHGAVSRFCKANSILASFVRSRLENASQRPTFLSDKTFGERPSGTALSRVLIAP